MSQHTAKTTALIERLTNRFWELSTASELNSDAVTQIAVGLNALLDEVREDPDLLPPEKLSAMASALDLLVQALEGTADPRATVPTSQAGVEQFIDAFRAEARKRLAGLSLSLRGVFDSEPQAIDQTINHLHAIRGGAAMLGLRSIAELSGVMEDVVLAARRTGDDHWPVRPLLRGFAMLESAVDEPDSGYDNIIRNITDELHGYLGEFATEHATRTLNAFENQPVTDVRKQPLAQRILVVDDVETIAHSVGLILSELDIPIDVSHDGNDALQLLKQHPYSLVVSDVAMPGMTGLELCRAIRADEALSDLPVILLTALDRPPEREAGLQAGASDYIVKGSIGGGELISRVNDLLQTAPVVPARPNEDGPFKNVLVVEDIETIAASIAFVLSEGPYEITLAHNGREALDMLDNDAFDLVITDLEMPKLNGYQLITALREDDRYADLPVVLLTAQGSDEHRAEAMRVGASRFLVKGEVGGGKLLDIVGNFFGAD